MVCESPLSPTLSAPATNFSRSTSAAMCVQPVMTDEMPVARRC
jgi:hypothetical protein